MSGASDPFAALGAHAVDPFAALGARPVQPSAATMTPQELAAEANRQFAQQGLPAASQPTSYPQDLTMKQSPLQQGINNASDYAHFLLKPIGNAIKGVNQSGFETAKNLGDYVLGPKTRPAFDSFVNREMQATAPEEGPAAKVGRAVEQGLELASVGPEEKGGELFARFAPEGGRLLRSIGRIGGAGASGAASAELHNADPTAGALGAEGMQALGELTPLLAKPLRNAAVRQYREFFGNNGNKLNAIRNEVVPELLDRGIRTKSAEDLADFSGENFGRLGNRIDDLIGDEVERANRPNLSLKALPAPKENIPIPASPNAPRAAAIPAERITVIRPADLTKLDVDPNAPPQRLLPLGPVEPPQQLPLTEGEGFFLNDSGERPNGFGRPRAYQGEVIRPVGEDRMPQPTLNESASDRAFRNAHGTQAAGAPLERPLVDLRPVQQALADMRGSYQTRGIPDSTASLPALQNLERELDLLRSHGDFIPLRDARSMRQNLDGPLSSHGAFYQAPEDRTKLAQQLTKANALRHQIGETVPDIKPLNKEAHFWANVMQVAGKRAEKGAPPGRGLGRSVVYPMAALLGIAQGGALPAAREIGAASLLDALNSPGWQTASAVAKSELSKRAASGALRRIATRGARGAILAGNAATRK